ncbi:Methyltransferase domain protein [Actinomadura rubteroloni]|uniref:Methyltransferase domain protein n=1 Tax=Actinomadura rubteroloni TaxID=1926885 RepID=A0A2P4UEJ7_9ACTN|nr:class I SAM-dependent methyltransferase [Actinomadura rubteroloni]POM23494.1 Methyltransferase domain protein [Actinomadura rubteroloni]
MEANEARVQAPADERVRAAAESYKRPMLAAYDWIVLGFVSRWMWRCSRWTMLKHYDAQVGARHLDIGPGTGWFLDRCRFPVKNPDVTLVDLNETPLATAARRIRRHRPATHVRDVYRPLDLGAARFDSVGMNFLLHCLPGTVAQKAVVFDHVVPYLAPGARVFGSTVLGTGPHHTKASGRLLLKLNRSEVFNNADDRLDDLARELAARFGEVDLRVKGAVCLFSARFPAA